MIHFKDNNKSKSALSTRWAQMSKQEQIIEKKKQEIQAKLEAQKQAAALAAQAKLSSPVTQEEQPSNNIFSNDGSFMTQFKQLIEKQKKEKLEKEKLEKDKLEKEKPPKPKEIDKPVVKDTKDVKPESKSRESRRKEQHRAEHKSKNTSFQHKKTSSQKKEYVDKWTDDWNKIDLMEAKEKDHYQRDRPRERNRSRWSDKGRNRFNIPPNIKDETNGKKETPVFQIPFLDGSAPSDFENQWNIAFNRGDNGPKYMRPGSNDDGPRLNMGSRSNIGPNLGTHMGPNQGSHMGPNQGSHMGPNQGSHMGPNQGSRMGPGPMTSSGQNMGPRANIDGRNNSVSGLYMGPGPNIGHVPHIGNMSNSGHGSNIISRYGSNIGPRSDIDSRGDMDLGPNKGSQPNMGFGTNMNMSAGHNMPPLPNMSLASHMPPLPNMSSAPNMSPLPHMSSAPNMPPLPNMNSASNMPPLPNMSSGSNLGHPTNSGSNPVSQGSGFNMNSMPPFMSGSKFPNMPPPFMGPGGSNFMVPPGPTTPPGQGGNGPPMPPFFGSFPKGPNDPPDSNLPLNKHNNMSFMPPFASNFPPNNSQSFIPPSSLSGSSIPPPIDPKLRESSNIPPPPDNMRMSSIPPPPDNMRMSSIPPPPDNMRTSSIPPPMPQLLNQIPKPNDRDIRSVLPPLPPQIPQVLSADGLPPPVRRFAEEVAHNGDHWENVLKAVHSQENMWFLYNTNSNEYKMFREVVLKLRQDIQKKQDVRPEDKYEPEFSLEDEDSNDQKPIKQEDSGNGYNQSHYQSNWDDQNFRNSGYKREPASSQSDDEDYVKERRKKKKKSRWGNEPPAADIKPPGVMAPMPPNFTPAMPPLPPNMPPLPPNMPPNIPSLMATPLQPPAHMPGMKLAKVEDEGMKLTNINRGNPALMQYAMTNFGTTNLSVEDWKKCEDNFKLNLLFQDMLKKRQEVEKLAAAGKHKYEYDSDEDTREGTWEHKLRSREMNATEKWADELTKQAAGKHHIGDFLPPEELKKFMEKYSAAKSGMEPNLSDYKEFKLKEDNVGFKMLQKLGWNEGQGLGADGSGIVDPVNKSNQPVANLGLGAGGSDAVSADDDEFDAYRKRMMLAYRFRPNPMNNPRRPYY